MIGRCLAMPLFLCLVTSLQAGEDHDHRPHLRGQPLAMEQLPDVALRRQLAALPAPARERALRRLAQLHFCNHDLPLMFASANGEAIGIACPITLPAGASLPVVAGPPQGAPVPIANPPSFSSRPGSTKAIYLDFNGGTVTGTQWNSSTFPSWNCRPFDTDADETTFSDAEQLVIERVWRRVSEDFSPWDVNVTTVQPGSGVTWSQAMITRDTDATGQLLPGSGSAAGIAFVDVFGLSAFKPAFVYFNTLSSREDYIAEATSHEIGHNLSLAHDGTNTVGYYAGHAGTTSLTSWGPIMGTGYNDQVSQWSRGEYTNANNSEDDVAEIGARLPLRADDHGNSVATATALNDLTGTLASAGVIASASDSDALAFSAGAGPATLSVTPFVSATNTRGGNLDLRLELYTSASVLVATAAPTGATNASISQTLVAGDYVLMIRNSGEPTPPATGYTTYASLGQWTMTGTTTAPDPLASVVASDGQASEVGADPGAFTISLASAPTGSVTIGYTLTGTALSGDYAATTGSVTITGPATAATVVITPVTDALLEGTESVTLTLQTGTGYRVGTPASGSLQIADMPTATVTATDGSAAETGPDSATFTFSVANPAAGSVTINYSLSGTAGSSADYIALSGIVTITSPATTATITLTPLADTLSEGQETVTVTIVSGTGYAVGTPASATATIVDAFAVATQQESNKKDCGLGSGLAVMTLMLLSALRLRRIPTQRS